MYNQYNIFEQLNEKIIEAWNSTIQTPTLLLPAIYLLFVTLLMIIFLDPDDRGNLRTWTEMHSISFFVLLIPICYFYHELEATQITSRGKLHMVYRYCIFPEYDFFFSVGVDGLSMCFCMLAAFIFPAAIFTVNRMKGNVKSFLVAIFAIQLFLYLSFITTNLIFFYIFFEAILIPMYILIGIWGARERKTLAAMYFVLYTAAGSFFLLYGAYHCYQKFGTLEYRVIINKPLSFKDQLDLWKYFFIPFAIKIPMLPFHIWLPEAHVEAPTVGSVYLASLLLKLGGYGFLRFTITMFEHANAEKAWLINLLAVFGVIFASLMAMRQNDLKRVVAYSSVAHMNLVVLGLFSYTQQGLEGAIYLMIGHGIVSGALFLSIGVLYDRYHTRSLKHYSGLANVMPLFCGFFFLFTLGNMAFPGTSNFVGEILILIGLFEYHSVVMFFASTGVVLGAVYSIWMFNRTTFGTLKSNTENIAVYADITRPEVYVFVAMLAGMIALGLDSSPITHLTSLPIKKMLIGTVYKCIN